MSDATKSNTPLANAYVPNMANGDFPLPKVYPTEPASYSKKAMAVDVFSPFVAAVSSYNGFVYAIGMYGIGGGCGKLTDTVPDAFTGTDRITAKLNADQEISVYNISVARDVADGLSVGLGVDMLNMSDKLNVGKAYDINTGSALTGSGLSSYSINASNDATGSAVQVDLGAKYKVSDKLNLGLVLRSGASVDLKGTATYDQTGLASVGEPDARLSSTYDKYYNYPSTIDLGLSYQLLTRLTVAAGVSYDMYYNMKNDVTYAKPVPMVFDNVDETSHWNSEPLYRVGAQYACNDNFQLRGGVSTDPTPFAVDEMTFLNINQFSMTQFTVGVGYSLGKVHMDGEYTYSMSDEPSQGARTTQFPVNGFRLDLKYSF
jgi:long-subunit fatty acid transport protein